MLEFAGSGSDLAVGISLGVGLAAATGFRIFLPLLITGLAMRFHLLPVATQLAEGQSWIASPAAIIAFSLATILEILAYKIPILDHALDVVGAPAALVAGALLATLAMVHVDDPLLRYGLGIIAGAGSAAIVHGATAAARVVSTKTTAGIANPFFALGEALAAVVSSFLVLAFPYLGAFVFLALLLVLWGVTRRRRIDSAQKGNAHDSV